MKQFACSRIKAGGIDEKIWEPEQFCSGLSKTVGKFAYKSGSYASVTDGAYAGGDPKSGIPDVGAPSTLGDCL